MHSDKAYKSIFLNIGELAASREPATIGTVLGSCVSVALWDRRLKAGGLNHFKLPSHGSVQDANPMNFGDRAVRGLHERMLLFGSRKADLRAKLFGGGCLMCSWLDHFEPIGELNIEAARQELALLGIPIVGSHTGGKQGRRISMDTSTGEVSVTLVEDTIRKIRPPHAAEQLKCINCEAQVKVRQRL